MSLPPELLSPQQFAVASGFSVPTIRRYLALGLLPKVQPRGKRGRVGIPRTALAEFVGKKLPEAPPSPVTSETPTEPPRRKRLSGPSPRWLSQKSEYMPDPYA